MTLDIQFQAESSRLFRPGISLPVLYLSPHFAVIAKPAGMALYRTKNTHAERTVEEYFLPQKRGGPWLVHRLDQDTAGCLLIARRKTALIAAQAQFADKAQSDNIQKTYWAILDGVLPPSLGAKGEINLPLYKVRQKQSWHMEAYSANHPPSPMLQKQLLPARTKWRKIGESNDKTWLELILVTGRTHQARLHCLSLGAPILGDPFYGVASPNSSNEKDHQLCLLAYSLLLKMPNGEKINATMKPPAFMAKFLKQINSEIQFLKRDRHDFFTP